VGVTPSVPVKANSGVRARVPAAGKVLEGDDKPTLLREDQHYLHYNTMSFISYRVRRSSFDKQRLTNEFERLIDFQ